MSTTAGTILSYLIGVLVIVASLLTLFQTPVGVLPLALGILLLPVVRRQLDVDLPRWATASIGGLAILLVVVAVIAAALAAGGGSGAAEQQASAPAATATAAPTTMPSSTQHQINEPFVVGSGDQRVEYVVTNITTADHLGGQYGDSANGVFVIVTVEVTNVGDETFRLTDVFRLVDDQDRSYAPDDEGMVHVEDVTYEQVNPDLTVRGAVVFDVPVDQQGRQLEIRPAGVFSGADRHYVTLPAQNASQST